MPTDPSLETLLADRTRFRRLLHVASCTSTQDLAAAATPAGDAVFWADHQTTGRGRQQRHWHDEPGADLAATFRVTARLPQPLALAAALPVAVLEAIEPVLARRLCVKWPNDLLLDQRKLCGVLIDTGVAGPDVWLIGVGVNCNRVRFPPDLEATATSIALATGHLTDRAGLLLAIARRLDALLTDLEAQQLDSWLTKFRDRLGLLGQRVVVDAGTCLDGVLEGVDFAHVRLDGGRSLPLAIVRGIRPAR